jgi:protein-S-isoprenylcysteine O-methyltransferase Ste14
VPVRLWVRGAIFSMLLPGSVFWWGPMLVRGGAAVAGGWWQLGWLVAGAGLALYLWCLLLFLASGGTPALFFTRPARAIIGEEPRTVVRNGPYRFSRNPMYLSMVTAIAGQAIAYRSALLAAYLAIVWLCFEVIVVVFEEPHLRRERGAAYEEYCRRVRRWL